MVSLTFLLVALLAVFVMSLRATRPVNMSKFDDCELKMAGIMAPVMAGAATISTLTEEEEKSQGSEDWCHPVKKNQQPGRMSQS